MILTTTENIPGKQYEIIGIAKGNMIQTKNIGRDISQGLKSIVGGELKNYVKMMNESRSIATKRMVEDAEAQGADAIVCMRYRPPSAPPSPGTRPCRRWRRCTNPYSS